MIYDDNIKTFTKDKMNLGLFSLTDDFVDAYPNLVMKLMGNMIVLNAYTYTHKGIIGYLAWSPKYFEAIKDDFIPKYMFKVDANTENIECSKIEEDGEDFI